MQYLESVYSFEHKLNITAVQTNAPADIADIL